MFAHELCDTGDDVTLVFDGAGSVADAELAQPGRRKHALYTDVNALVRGVCRYCAKLHGVLDAIEAFGLPLLGDDRGHASLRQLQEGRQVVTF